MPVPKSLEGGLIARLSFWAVNCVNLQVLTCKWKSQDKVKVNCVNLQVWTFKWKWKSTSCVNFQKSKHKEQNESESQLCEPLNVSKSKKQSESQPCEPLKVKVNCVRLRVWKCKWKVNVNLVNLQKKVKINRVNLQGWKWQSPVRASNKESECEC